MTATDVSTELREWVGRIPRATVEAGAVRRFVDALDDPNPLWVDHGHAQSHGFRAAVAPTTFLDRLKPFYLGVPYPHDTSVLPHFLSASDRYELREPVCVGDQLDVETRFLSREEKRRSDGGRMIFISYRTTYRRPTGSVAAHQVWTGVHFEGSSSSANPTHLGDEPSGKEVPAVVVTPSRADFARWAGAVHDYQRIHIDEPYAIGEQALPSVVGHGSRTGALLARVLSDWCTPGRLVTRLDVEYRTVSLPDRRVTARGWVRGDASADDGCDAVVALVDDDGAVVTRGTGRLDPITSESWTGAASA